MRGARKYQALAVVGMVALLGPGNAARGQGAVAFAPSIGTIPDGVTMSVRPVVSADRRYVRLMDLNPTFIDFDRFDTFTIPAAVGGGGNGGLGGFPGGGIGGGGLGGGLGLGGGGAGGGFRSFGANGQGALSGFADSRPLGSFVVADPNPPARGKATRSRSKGTTKRKAR